MLMARVPAALPLSRARIGILTFHRCINYGSYWQARCLVEGLRAKGMDAVLLDHQSSAIERAELRCAFRPTLPSRTPRSDFPAYSEKTRKFRDAFSRLPLSSPFALDRPEESEPYDIIIVGSDEVWNLDHPWYGGCSTFYGAGLSGRLLSYAASFGNQPAARGLPLHWARHLHAFAALSVRDENSRNIVRAALGRDVPIVLDPCLQFPLPGATRTEEQPYVAVYGHNFPGWLKAAVRRWAAARGVRLVSIGYRNDWTGEQRLTAGPEEFSDLIAGARAVVTNFFHGCIFALLHDRPLVTAPTPYRFNKVHSLMQSLGTPAHIVSPDTKARDYERLLSEPPDAAGPIAALRRQSGRFLEQALEMAG